MTAPARFTLRSVAFRAERERAWRALEAQVTRVERGGLRVLAPAELARLPQLYRTALSSLSVARAISLDRNLTDYLESLCGRAYLCLYGTRRRAAGALGRFFATEFPATVRRHWRFVALSAAFLLMGALVGFVLTSADAERVYSFVAPAMAQGRDPGASTEFLRKGLYGSEGAEAGEGGLAVFAAFLFTHNTQVGFLCFTLGFLAGLPVAWLLFTNGLVLGALAALYHGRGLAWDLWGWILPHGVPEILAIVLCGAAGLVLAQALIVPGRHTRLENLALAGPDAGRLAGGTMALFAFAGLIEGFFRQLVTDPAARYALATANAVLLGLYFWRAGRAPAGLPRAPEGA